MNQSLLDRLIAVRENGRRIDELTPGEQPASLDEAYATADALARWTARETVGWKIGASLPRGQQALGLSEPFGGRVFVDAVYRSGQSVTPLLDTLVIGAEYTCRISRDLRADERFDPTTIALVVAEITPSLELNQVGYVDPVGAGGLAITADNGFNAGLVLGEPIGEWVSAYNDLLAQPVSFALDDVEQGHGSAGDIGFDPLEALAWLANDRAQRSDPLQAGYLVATGDLVGAIEARRGSSVTASFGPWGTVAVTLT